MTAAADPAPADFDVLTLGEPLVVFAAEEAGPLAQAVRFRRHCAGAELNLAIGLARLGLRVGYASRVGEDALGRMVLQRLQAEGMTASLVRLEPGCATGFMLKSRSAQGHAPEIEYHRRGSAASRMGPQDLERLAHVRARHLHLTGIFPALSAPCRELAFAAVRWARDRAMSISFDPNLRPMLWRTPADMVRTLNALAAACDLVLPGLEEGRQLTGQVTPEDIARRFLARGAREVVVKLGPEGAWHAAGDREGRAVRGEPAAAVVDPVGAGDGFAAGVVSGLLEGLDMDAAVRRGHAIGARVVQFAGDNEGLPTRAELQA